MHARDPSDRRTVADPRPAHPARESHADQRGDRPSTPLSPTALLTLQRTAGNAAVTRMLGEQGAVQRTSRKRPAEDELPGSVEQGRRERTSPGVEAAHEAEQAQAVSRGRRKVVDRNHSPEDLLVAERDSKLRMLDRLARVLIFGLRLKDQAATPYISVWFDGGKINIKGNSQQPITRTQKSRAVAVLRNTLKNRGPLQNVPPRFQYDADKLRKVVAGSYVPEDFDETWMTAFGSALETLEFNWLEDPGTEGVGRHWHGEMFRLREIIDKYTKKNFFGSKTKEKELLGGSKMPCPACRWVIDEVNATFGERYGFEVEVGGRHKSLYPWSLPDWLLTGKDQNGYHKRIRERVEREAKSTRGADYNPKTGELSVKGAVEVDRHEPPRSGSEYEPD